jgi:hypothetical protein
LNQGSLPSEELKHVASPSQLAANKANAQYSTGPKTEQSKQRTRLNAYRHGLTGQICIFTPEEREAFDDHCSGIRQALEPVGALELDLAQSIAEDRWRLKRARAVESGIYALGQSQPSSDDLGQVQVGEALAQARTWLADGKNLQLLTLYEQRIHRAVEKNTAQLTALQTKRQAVAQKALEEAQLLAQLAYAKGETYDPARDFPPGLIENGSDFSRAAINRLIGRNRRLEEARHHGKGGWTMKYAYEQPFVQIPKAA